MNKIITIIFCVCVFIIKSQDTIPIPKNQSGLAEYSDVIIVDSSSKESLYLSALEWVNKTYNSGKSVIQTSDKDGGLIIGKANGQTLIYDNKIKNEDGGYFSYTISIYCKDNKIKYVIDNIKYHKGFMLLPEGSDLAEFFPSNWKGFIANNKHNKKEWRSFQSQANLDISLIVTSLKIHLLSSKKKSNW